MPTEDACPLPSASEPLSLSRWRGQAPPGSKLAIVRARRHGARVLVRDDSHVVKRIATLDTAALRELGDRVGTHMVDVFLCGAHIGG